MCCIFEWWMWIESWIMEMSVMWLDGCCGSLVVDLCVECLINSVCSPLMRPRHWYLFGSRDNMMSFPSFVERLAITSGSIITTSTVLGRKRISRNRVRTFSLDSDWISFPISSAAAWCDAMDHRFTSSSPFARPLPRVAAKTHSLTINIPTLQIAVLASGSNAHCFNLI